MMLIDPYLLTTRNLKQHKTEFKDLQLVRLHGTYVNSF